MDWLADNPWLAWVGLALVLAAIEAATVDFVFIMVAGGALAGAVAAGVGASFPVQVVVAVLVAIVLIIAVRPLLKRHFMDTETDHGIGAPSLVGRSALVVQTVPDYDGRIKLAGETWSARLVEGEPPAEAGAEVRVLSIDGATAIVTATDARG